VARDDDAARGQIKAAIAFVRCRVAEEHTSSGTWCELVCRGSRKVRIAETPENPKIGQIRRLSIETRKRNLMRNSRAWATI
jgi:hypothetical protein